jgi:hypothetical protein
VRRPEPGRLVQVGVDVGQVDVVVDDGLTVVGGAGLHGYRPDRNVDDGGADGVSRLVPTGPDELLGGRFQHMLKSSGDSLMCARCNSPFARGQLVRDDFGLDPPTPAHSFCSTLCRDRAVAAWLSLPTCAQCGNRFAPTSGPDQAGRPPSYCSPACRRSHERTWAAP